MTGSVYRKNEDGTYTELRSPQTLYKKGPNNSWIKVIVDLEEDILFVTRLKDKRLAFHTSEGELYQLESLEDVEAHLGFQSLDSTNVVNMSKIKHIDEYRNVHFDYPPVKGKPFASIASSVYHAYNQDGLLDEIMTSNRGNQYTVTINSRNSSAIKRLAFGKG
ncbi:hypothetical protein [Paenibacillus elgii]|uniref:hypothetical protein n=1 Tax=Paenibacillus elgii TaxID=189691 RepID=UPI0013D8D230|nr:hypothetical protein [Paenibacillus elgii]